MDEPKILKRPNRLENEFDLLREQETFLQRGGTNSKISVKLMRATKSGISGENNPEKAPDPINSQPVESARIIFDVTEKNLDLKSFQFHTQTFACENTGFPAVFKVDANERSFDGKCLFSKYFEKNEISANQNQMSTSNSVDSPVKSNANFELPACQTPLDNLRTEIHNENMRIMESMSEIEKIEQRKKLLKSLDPALVTILQSKGRSSDFS